MEKKFSKFKDLIEKCKENCELSDEVLNCINGGAKNIPGLFPEAIKNLVEDFAKAMTMDMKYMTPVEQEKYKAWINSMLNSRVEEFNRLLPEIEIILDDVEKRKKEQGIN